MESDTEREGFSMCLSKGQHSTGYHLGCLVAGVSCHPTAGIGKGQRELLVWAAGWGTEPGVWLPHPPCLLCRKEEIWNGGIRIGHAKSNMNNVPVFHDPQDNRSSKLHLSIPPTLYCWLTILASPFMPSETRTRSGLSLGFSICSSSLVWQWWRWSRDRSLVREGMRLLTGAGVKWSGPGLHGGDRWLYLR